MASNHCLDIDGANLLQGNYIGTATWGEGVCVSNHVFVNKSLLHGWIFCKIAKICSVSNCNLWCPVVLSKPGALLACESGVHLSLAEYGVHFAPTLHFVRPVRLSALR